MDSKESDEQNPSGSKKSTNENASKQNKKIKDGTSVKAEGSFKRGLLAIQSHLRIIKSSKNETHKQVSENSNKLPNTVPDKGKTLTDAAPMVLGQFESIENIERDEEPVRSTQIVVDKYAEEYNMTHMKRGRAIIFNHEFFENEDTREGTTIDVKKLEDTLTKLDFEVTVYNDLEYSSIRTTLKAISKEDHTDNDCIAFFVLTHGNKKREISAKELYYPVDKLWENFTSENCITLAGKPKLFFINACRGKRKDAGVRFFQKGRTQADSSKTGSYKTPEHADFLIAYSTVQNYLSYRDPANGTWFIQCFCDALLEHHNTKDLLKILTITARKVAVDHQTQSEIPADCELTQVPSFTSMLIRDVYLRTST